MARPQSDDPKRAVTVRVRASVLARITADGGSERAVIEGLVEERFGGVVVRAARVEPAVHVDVALFQRPKFNPQPKPGKKR